MARELLAGEEGALVRGWALIGSGVRRALVFLGLEFELEVVGGASATATTSAILTLLSSFTHHHMPLSTLILFIFFHLLPATPSGASGILAPRRPASGMGVSRGVAVITIAPILYAPATLRRILRLQLQADPRPQSLPALILLMAAHLHDLSSGEAALENASAYLLPAVDLVREVNAVGRAGEGEKTVLAEETVSEG